MARGRHDSDHLPELDTLLGLASKPLALPLSNLRRSLRKQSTAITYQEMKENYDIDALTTTSKQPRLNPARSSPKKNNSTTASHNRYFQTALTHVPLLPRSDNSVSISASSNNRSSPKSLYKPAGFPHVDSLLLPLSKVAVQDDTGKTRTQPRFGSTRTVPDSQQSMMSMVTDAGRNDTARKSSRKPNPVSSQTSRYILKEARCNDDEEDSGKDEEDDEETDLSGFIVDDGAELSYHESGGSDFEEYRETSKAHQRSSRRRLQRGSRRQANSKPEYVDLTNDEDDVASALQHMTLETIGSNHTASELDVIDLTSSPIRPDDRNPESNLKLSDPFVGEPAMPVSRNLFDDFDRILRLSPPKLNNTMSVPGKSLAHENCASTGEDINEPRPTGCETSSKTHNRYMTPPATPPRSPSKLKSPSKLLSPSKRDINLHSPHRQSTDAFWDLNTVNEWHDVNSPKKAPTASPRKTGLARFQIWSDDSEDETSRISDTSLPSPCESPTKRKSPQKSPEKAEKKRIADERRAEKAKKAAFDTTKRQMAQDLLNELDSKITEGKLGKLAASTGGVNINWSKTLRSTAGRANWRRTVTKNSGSPIKGNVTEGPGVKVEHFANIELAEKVIDCEERLVNTLAHEFCHLANFMVSNIRDQPHGASFKSWASKVTKHLKRGDNELWKKVEVTTKHNYAINHKYLWVCVGREKTKTMEFLNLEEDDEGCGAEYGRHSKSIDTEKSRCGRCKGKLVQVRPKPRLMSPVKKGQKMEKTMEIIELSD